MGLKFQKLFTLILLLTVCNQASASVTNSGAAGVLCDIMIFLTGRIGRAIGILVVMGIAFACFSGSITWQKAATLCVGLSLFFAPATIAMMMLPSKVSNVSGTVGNRVFYTSNSYTPEEVASAACPEMF